MSNLFLLPLLLFMSINISMKITERNTVKRKSIEPKKKDLLSKPALVNLSYFSSFDFVSDQSSNLKYVSIESILKFIPEIP